VEGLGLETSEIRKRIEHGIPGSRVEVTGADNHYSAVVVSQAFEGMTRLEQHRMIYALFREEMASQEIHALSLKTCTPAEQESDRAQKR
jgi:acid stress-induced BolA-like protein IbaG/YrbA